MFIDEKHKKEEARLRDNDSYPSEHIAAGGGISYMRIAAYSIVGLILLLALGISFIFYTRPKPAKNNPSAAGRQNSTSTSAHLPAIYNPDGENEGANDTSTEFLKAEEVAFGNYYFPITEEFKPIIESYELPINIKSDVANYYDASRKINLDPYVDYINQHGFAVINNQFSQGADDFFGIYRYLISKDLPIVMTSDFVFYYYQNELKQVFKEIEKSAFYDNMWQINKSLYDVALTRYKRRLSDYGPANDPVLEGMRLETAYLAVALKLLAPTQEQINTDVNFTDENKFNTQESNEYTFDMLESLAGQVSAEADLIREGRVAKKSPVLLYQRDYFAFKVPSDYTGNAKLNNFYLATKWLSTVFPLYYLNEDCEDCLLDYNDWMINMAAAGLLAKDLSDNQELKNQWAIIYKFMSFFKGLRQDLTYLDYNASYEELFGPDYSVEKIYSNDNEKRDNDLAKIQKKIADLRFFDIEGTYNRSNKELKKILGMRMLQEPYWPNNFLFNQLTGDDMAIRNNNKIMPITACKRAGGSAVRCLAFGLDIVNLLEPVESDDDYFIANTNYNNYSEKIDFLRQKFNAFDKYTWNNNIYWNILDISKRLLEPSGKEWPVYMRSGEWQEKKNYNTVLGGWVDLHLRADLIEGYYDNEGNGGFGGGIGCNELNYIEPRVDFIRELIAKSKMLKQTLEVLGVAKKTNAAAIELKELNGDLEQILAISEKEMRGERLDQDDCKFIVDLAGHNKITKYGDRDFLITMENSGRAKIRESIKGVKLLILIYNKDGEETLAVGPVFNYYERK